MAKINRKHYRELNLILWDMHCKYIDEKVAFALYERRWAYIDETNMLPKEKRLVKSLTRKFGNNIFLARD